MARVKQSARTRTASVDVSDSLMHAALALIENEGLAALTVRSVAIAAGVAPMGVYSRFGSKDGLLEALFVHGFETLDVTIETPADVSPLKRLHRGCLGYRKFAMTYPQLYHLMFEQMMVLELSPQALASAHQSFATLVARVNSAMSSGQLALGDCTEVAQQIWSAMHGAVSLEIAGVYFTVDPAKNFTSMIDALLTGLSGRFSPE